MNPTGAEWCGKLTDLVDAICSAPHRAARPPVGPVSRSDSGMLFAESALDRSMAAAGENAKASQRPSSWTAASDTKTSALLPKTMFARPCFQAKNSSGRQAKSGLLERAG